MKLSMLFSKYIAALTDAAMVYIALVTLTGHSGSKSTVLPPFYLLLLIPLVLLTANLLLTRRKMAIPLFSLINLLFLAGFLYVIFRTTNLQGVGAGGIIMLIMGICVCLGRIISFSLTTPGGMSRIIQLDLYVLFLLWYLLSVELGNVTTLALPWLAGIFILNMVSVAQVRSGGNTDAYGPVSGPVLPGIGIYAACIGAIVAAALGLSRLFSNESARILSGIIKGLKAFFSFIWDILYKVILWLASFTDISQEPPAAPPPETGDLPGASPVEIRFDFLVLKIIGIVIAAGILAILVTLLIKNRKSKLSAKTLPGRPHTKTKTRHVKGGFSRWLSQLLGRIRFHMTYLKNKNSLPGLLIWLERRAARCGAARVKGETMQAFVRRIDSAGVLGGLDAALNAWYFSPSSTGLSPAQCRRLRRDYAKAVPIKTFKKPKKSK